MRHSAQPRRQCIGCRMVQPKEELIRLVLLPSGKTLFDVAQTYNGRGIYLCPERKCFLRAFNNKKLREYFSDHERLEDLFPIIKSVLCARIKRYLAVAAKMHCLKSTEEEIDHLSRDDVIVLNTDISQDQKKKICTAAAESGAAVIDTPGDCIQEAASLFVKDDFPMIMRLKRDLRICERLSSKGLAI